jgi:hypothetical protein
MVLLGVAALRDFSRLHEALPWRTMDDFADFYCAGWILDRRADPYTYEPLRTCEHGVNVGNSFRDQLFLKNPSVAVPAPLPAFDFLPFMGLARLPFADARATVAVAIVAAVVLCVIALAALGVPWEIAAAALALSTAYASLNTGQIVPFALLCLILCGFALARRNEAIAGLFAALTAIEPTVGVPVIAATFLFAPRARGTLLLSLLGLAVLSLIVVGPHALAVYAVSVLPAQAAAEVHFPFQYSLTYALAYVGLSPSFARIGGVLSYSLLLVVGVLLAPRVKRAFERPELLVFIPALCTSIGGTYLHPEELAFALPALLSMAPRVTGSARIVLALALCALAIPWIPVWGTKQLFLASVFVCAVILLRLQIRVRASFGWLCAIAAVIYGLELHPPRLPVPATSARIYAPNELVQREWHDYAEGRRTPDVMWFLIKLPAWGALFAGLAVAARNGRS